MFFTRIIARRSGRHLETGTTSKGRRAFRPEGDELESRRVLSTFSLVGGMIHVAPVVTAPTAARATAITSPVGPGGGHFPPIITTPSGVLMTLRGLNTSATPSATSTTNLTPKAVGTGEYHFPPIITTPSGVLMTLRGR